MQRCEVLKLLHPFNNNQYKLGDLHFGIPLKQFPNLLPVTRKKNAHNQKQNWHILHQNLRAVANMTTISPHGNDILRDIARNSWRCSDRPGCYRGLDVRIEWGGGGGCLTSGGTIAIHTAAAESLGSSSHVTLRRWRRRHVYRRKSINSFRYIEPQVLLLNRGHSIWKFQVWLMVRGQKNWKFNISIGAKIRNDWDLGMDLKNTLM